MRCWGDGEYGVLGTDSTNDIMSPDSTLGYIPFSDTSEVVSLSQGGYASHVICSSLLLPLSPNLIRFHLIFLFPFYSIIIVFASGLCPIHIIEGEVLGLQ